MSVSKIGPFYCNSIRLIYFIQNHHGGMVNHRRFEGSTLIIDCAVEKSDGPMHDTSISFRKETGKNG